MALVALVAAAFTEGFLAAGFFTAGFLAVVVLSAAFAVGFALLAGFAVKAVAADEATGAVAVLVTRLAAAFGAALAAVGAGATGALVTDGAIAVASGADAWRPEVFAAAGFGTT